MELSLEGWIFDLQRSRRGLQADGDEERHEDQNGWGSRAGAGQERGRGEGRPAWEDLQVLAKKFWLPPPSDGEAVEDSGDLSIWWVWVWVSRIEVA